MSHWKDVVWNKIKELAGIDVRALAAMRIAFALLILADLFNRVRSIKIHYGDSGVMPSDVLFQSDLLEVGAWSLHTINGSTGWQVLLFVVAAVCAVMLLVGWRTRLATICSWILLVSLQNSNPLLLQGGDVVFRLALFWGMFLPWGQVYSVDVALKPARRLQTKVVSSMGTFAFIMQIAIVYFYAGLHKTGESWRVTGQAVYQALAIDQFATKLADVTLRFPMVMKGLTFFTLWTDRLAAVLIFSPFATRYTRTLIAIALIGMHLGFAAHMRLGLFPFISMATFIALIPTYVWDWLFARLKTSERTALTLYFDGTCGMCKTLVRIIKTFFLIPETKLIPAQHNPEIETEMFKQNSWIVVDHTGTHHTHFDGVIAVVAHSPLLWWSVPLVRLSWIQSIGARVYAFVANHRGRVCTLEELAAERDPVDHDTSYRHVFILIFDKIFISLIIVSILGSMVWWNTAGLPHTDFGSPRAMRRTFALLRLDQHWNMFAPYPLTDDGWFVMAATLANGDSVDIFQGNESLVYTKPADVSATYPTQRWRKYMMNLWLRDNSDYRKPFAHATCAQWNAAHTPDEALESFTMIFMREDTLAYRNESTPTRVELGSWVCDSFFDSG